MLMLTSGGKPGDIARCRELRIGAYLTKPVTPPDLFEGVMALRATGAAGRAVAEPTPVVPCGRMSPHLREGSHV